MRVLLVENDRVPREVDIQDSLAAMQKAVSGPLAILSLSDKAIIIYNLNAEKERLWLNRAIRVNDNVVEEAISGTFFICRFENGAFSSLSQKQSEKYKKRFFYPEGFSDLTGELRVEKLKTPETKAELRRIKGLNKPKERFEPEL